MPLAVNDTSDEIKALACEWPMLQALQEGTAAMRKGGVSWLPKWPNEEEAAYAARLKTATLFPAYRRTVSVMAGKPFSKALTLKDAPKQIEDLSEDIDLQGVNLHAFAAEMFNTAVGYGLAGILVEYPRAEPAPSRTVADVERAGLRPYWVRVRHDQLLGWKIGKVDGGIGLLQLRLMESIEEADGPYGVKIVSQVRVLEPGKWETWRKVGDVWAMHESGVTSLKVVPFVPLYGVREAFMVGKPPLADLAYLNVKHWQSQSDQDTILHVARVPILAMIGADDSTQLTVGASSAVKLPQDADLKFVEHSGAAIDAGEKSLAALQEQMIQTGAELLVKRQGGDVSATEAGNDAEANKCDLQHMAETFEDSLDQALWLTAQYLRLPEGGSVSLFSDYGAGTLSDASAQLVADLNSRGLLTKKTTLQEMQRRGVIAADVDVDAEIEAAEAEGPALGAMTEPGAEGANGGGQL